jgi:hypothetical protein
MEFKDLFGNTPESFLFMVRMRPVRAAMCISYTSSEDEEFLVPCEIVEERYKVADGYKVTMRSIYEGFGQRHFYQSDMMSLIERGGIKALRKVDLKKEE